jgi:hypothetical protein
MRRESRCRSHRPRRVRAHCQPVEHHPRAIGLDQRAVKSTPGASVAAASITPARAIRSAAQLGAAKTAREAVHPAAVGTSPSDQAMPVSAHPAARRAGEGRAQGRHDGRSGVRQIGLGIADGPRWRRLQRKTRTRSGHRARHRTRQRSDTMYRPSDNAGPPMCPAPTAGRSRPADRPRPAHRHRSYPPRRSR